MNKQLLGEFVDKKIIVVLKNKFNYQGYIDSIQDDVIIFNDRLRGKCIFEIEDIKHIIPSLAKGVSQ